MERVLLILIVITLLTAMGCASALGAGYLLVLAVASLFHRPDRGRGPWRAHRLAVLVPAHDEERLVGRCVSSLLDQSYPRHLYEVVVIADNCSDATAELAWSAGAKVLVRDEPTSRGKGQALRWAMERLLATPEPPDAFVVVDADSIADRHLLAGLESRFAAGAQAVQGEYLVLRTGASVREELAAAAFLLFHRVRFSGRAALGLPASLVGNGMLFSRALLERLPWDAFTGAEDLEYSVNLRLAGVAPRFAGDARVYGPMPSGSGSAGRQRLRWEGGRFHVLRERFWTLVRSGVLDAALDLAVPPLALFVMATGAGFAAAALLGALGLAPGWLVALWAADLAALPAYVLVGLLAARAPRSAYLALARAPLFLAWKAGAYLRMLRGFDVNRWDRSDRDPEPESDARFNLCGVPIDAVDMPGALARIENAFGTRRVFQVATVNLDFVVRAQKDALIRGIFRESDLNVADGAPVVWLGRILGRRVPERVAGADLVPLVVEAAARRGSRVFLLGGENGSAQEAARRFQERHPDLVVAGWHEPPRAAVEDMDNEAILRHLEAAQADVLLVALGHPKQERWIDLNRDRLRVSVAIGVGCVFDLVAGRTRRAPAWMQRAGLEWLFRLGQEPRRLLSRYVTDASWLVLLTTRALLQRLA